MTSLDEKEKGATAWAAGDFPLSITHFTRAIEIGGDKDFLKVVYSNRSAANFKLNKFKEAIADATKCIDLDGNWAKGYTRKGDALYSSWKYTDAFNAYNSAKRLSPADKSLIDKCELAMKAMRSEADRAAGTSSNSPNPTSTVVPTGRLGKLVYYARCFLLISALLYLLPFGRAYSGIVFKLFAGSEIMITTATLYTRYGLPKFNMEYAGRVMQDITAIHLFLGVMLMISRPYLFAMAPVFLTEISHFSGPLFELCREKAPALESQIMPLLTRFLPSATNQNISTLFNSSSEKNFNKQLAVNAAMCELMQGVFLIVELILPTRNLPMIFMWWQYLQMRYMSDKEGHIKTAFASLDQRMSSVISHRLCPKVVGRGYDLLKKYLADKVKPLQRSAAAPAIPSMSSMFSNLKSKCSVM